MKDFSKVRFWLEVIALPFFIFLVVHLAGHGAMSLVGGEHDHGHYEEEGGEEFDEDHENEESHALSEEVLFGILFLCIFTWIWHRPFLARWIPCQHEHCHTSHSWVHIAAIIAFCVHFFPESQIRHQLLAHFSFENIVSVASIIGFSSHFLVDIIVAVSLSMAFSDVKYRWMSGGAIALLWILAFVLEGSFLVTIHHIGEGLFFLLSSFLLAIFIHVPHRPKESHSCDKH